MSRFVPHHRPELGDVIKSTLPVGSFDWGGVGSLTNFCQGHGGMLIPWTAIGHSITDTNTGTYRFYVAPKASAVERVWCINLRGSAAVGVSASVTVGGASAVTVYLNNVRDARTGSFVFRESLSSKTSTAGQAAFQVVAAGGTVTVESVAMYEQTRGVLDATTDDHGVDITTLRSRQPMADFDYQSVAGVMDAYKNLDVRRAGLFHWATDTGSELAITAGSGAPASLFPLSAPMAGAIPTYGDTTTTVTVAVYAKVNAGTGSVRFQSDENGDSKTLSVTATSYAWVTSTLTIETEDLAVADGRQSSLWEGVAIDAWVTATNTLNIAGISIVRVTAPI